MEKINLNDVFVVSEATAWTGIPKSSITKFCREERIGSRLAGGTVWLIEKDSLIEFQKKYYHPRLKRRKSKVLVEP